MLRKYKNALVDELVAAGLVVSDFVTDETHDRESAKFKITHAASNLTFHLIQPINQTDRFWVRAARYVGDGHWVESVQRGTGLRTIAQAARHFRNWLTNDVLVAIEDGGLPDMWAEAREVQMTTGLWSGSGDGEFTPGQREQIKLAVASFRESVVDTFNPDPEQVQFIDQKLSYLTSAVDRLNRFDWQAVGLSTLIGIATNLSLDTEKGRTLWRLFQQAVSAAWHLLT
jgi:hypothetical protein